MYRVNVSESVGRSEVYLKAECATHLGSVSYL